MSQTLEAGVAPQPAQPPDERFARRSPLARLLTRPEVGALLGAIVIYIVFFAVAPPLPGRQLARDRALRQLDLRHPRGRASRC